MKTLWIVLARELDVRVRTRLFVISTLLLPLFMIAVTALPLLATSGAASRRIVVVDDDPADVGSAFIEALTSARSTGEAPRFTVSRRLTGTLDAIRPELNDAIAKGEVDGYVYFPPDALRSNRVVYRARSIASFEDVGAVRHAATEALQARRLARLGVDSRQMRALLANARLETAQITRAGTEGSNAEVTFAFAYLMAMTTYGLILGYGAAVMRGVVEEKTSRVVEVVLSSIRAAHLLAGKVLGMACVALLQVCIWGGVAAVIVSQAKRLPGRLGALGGIVGALHVEPVAVVAMVAFLLLGFLLYASIFAAIGAAVSTEKEAQQLSFFPVMLLVVPLLLMTRIAAEPLGPLATTMGLVPLTSPIVMPLRMGASVVPGWQVAMSLAILAATGVAVTWVSGKIYSVGVLATGSRPSLRDLVRWVREG